MGGFNVYPAEIEGFLMKHAAVVQAAVIGVPDERPGRLSKAFVVAPLNSTGKVTKDRFR
jgi:acyl-CoA synthetase (AMP-forming)/AMP-acid ligase II